MQIKQIDMKGIGVKLLTASRVSKGWLNKKISLKKIFGCILIEEFVFVLYVLLFVTQGHPTWESIIDTVTMQTLLDAFLNPFRAKHPL